MNKYKILITSINILIINLCFCSEKNNLNIICFNIHGFGKILGGCNIESKINKIIDEISDFDLIFLQENWKYKELMLNKLTEYKLIFGNKKKNSFSYPSGLLIGVNKDIEILDYKEITYQNCHGVIANGIDCLASKGFIFSRIKYNNQIIDIYNTHLDSGNSLKDNNVREKQLNTLNDFIIENSLKNNIIICGDFNMNYNFSNKIKKFKESLGLDLLSWNNKYFLNDKVDYIFYRIMFPYEINKDEISSVLYTLSDHPPLTLNLQLR